MSHAVVILSYPVSPIMLLSEQDSSTVLVSVQENTTIVSGGVGFPGPPGPAGPVGSSNITAAAGEPLGGHRAVVLDADGLAWYADNTDAQHLGRVVGITLSAAVLGADATLQSAGYITEPSWNWTPYQPVYLSANGLLTQTPPTTGFMQVLGVALSATSLFIQLRDPIVII